MNVIVKPLITEKSLKEAQKGRYTFEVAKSANKTDVKNAIQAMFKVTVKGVLTNIIKGSKNKKTRFGIKAIPFAYKKARVSLAKGQKIDIFEEKSS